MKRRVKWLVFLMILTMLLVACQKREEESVTNQEEETISKQEDDASDSAQQEEVEEKQPEDESDNEAPISDTAEEVVSTSLIVYYCNANADGFDKEEKSVESLSPEAVMSALAEKGVTTQDIYVQKFEITEIEGKQSILLDLNADFASYLGAMGTSGEYYTIGSICNTYLEAYACEQIKVTVDGKELSTGHAEYPGYMSAFS